ncbi:hypothetical protein [Bacillus sp. AFS053548]|nr:hypothetical protein [Bacillus sp. AFS053548]
MKMKSVSHGLQGPEVPNGTYTLYADGENVEGFKVTSTATSKINVVH